MQKYIAAACISLDAMGTKRTLDEYETKLNAIDVEIEAIEALENEIQNAETIGETRLSGLFHEARTTKKGHWKTVSAFCNIENGELVVDHLDKLSDGRWSPQTRNRYDVILSTGVIPFMESERFRQSMKDNLWQHKAPRLQTREFIEDDRKMTEYMTAYDKEMDAQ